MRCVISDQSLETGHAVCYIRSVTRDRPCGVLNQFSPRDRPAPELKTVKLEVSLNRVNTVVHVYIHVYTTLSYSCT